MLPVIAIIGRPNVGKSTLFNVLTSTRDALVANQPGLTRDRQFGFGKIGKRPYIVVDTGGVGEEDEGVAALMAQQSMRALDEADAAIFVVDSRAGLTGSDEIIAQDIRRRGKPAFLAVNKSEGQNAASASAEFYGLGLGEPNAIAAVQSQGVEALINTVLASLPVDDDIPEAEAAEDNDGIRVAVIGRPNVGKSTLINRLIGEERLIAFDKPGTTRDAVAVPFERDGKQYTLVDTAGLRRRARVKETVEKFSAIKTLQAIEQAQVVVAVLDASEGITDQDAGILGQAMYRGRALVLGVNKWDGLSPEQREKVKRELDVRLPFLLDFARVHFISAKHGTAVGDLFKSVNEAYAAATRTLGTPELTRLLEQAVERHQPPLARGRRIKLRYAHQGGRIPPIIVVHGNQTERVPANYTRYLENTFRKAFKLYGTPIRIEYKTSKNPFEGRKNTLTPRQIKSKKRLMKRVKR
ncbi:MAG TPA: ribosome biogenesis GTPase Der [Gammaproteobacteria bacterium]|nr:ribosome biogenesis GTPase Der [Gammaproteobacteria bacterium]